MEHVVKLLPLRSLADKLVLHLSKSTHKLLLAFINVVLDTLKYCFLTMFIDGLGASIFLLFDEFFAASDVVEFFMGLTWVQGFHPSC